MTALNAMKIKFPGKSDEQACDLLDAVSYQFYFLEFLLEEAEAMNFLGALYWIVTVFELLRSRHFYIILSFRILSFNLL